MDTPRVAPHAQEEPEDGSPSLWDGEMVLRGLSPEVHPAARHLQARVLGGAEAAPAERAPAVDSLEVLAAAVGAVRSTIQDVAERGAPIQRVRVMHGRLDRGFAEMVEALLERRADDARRLLRDVSHDLRSPLNSVLFLAEALASEHSGSLSDVQRRQASVLYTAALSLVSLLNDLIDVARLGDGDAIEVVSEPFSVEAVLNQVDQLVGPLAAHRGVDLSFRLETLGPRRGDRRILTRLLINLVSNAVQASERGDRVDVGAVQGPGDGLRVIVSDDGQGADVSRLREILRSATVPEAGMRDRGWTHGLGLAICARLVEAAEGELTVDAAPGEGCRFTVDLPFPRS